ncbi:hypothetical protein [Bartonella raoultii]|uniref:Uncharacterized protein n=1 Tax=Bartonella raoultii TaxID=1457020 RepID=A0ABS7I9A4_9HYPH|nr:hypothetical protein [Bartonella raoultii]MBX4336237.1 hypothetical protein [Bartonella raoultii]
MVMDGVFCLNSNGLANEKFILQAYFPSANKVREKQEISSDGKEQI